MQLVKFPRTRHLQGSRLQLGDIADDKPIADLRGQALVVTEKLDGANGAVSFDAAGSLLLQSRGSYLSGGARERHFDLLKTWANTHSHLLRPILGQRYVMYGEWLYAKHTVYYDRLPHYFVEFDVLDRESGSFLSTSARRELLFGLPIMPAPIVYEGTIATADDVGRLIGASLFKSPTWRETLRQSAAASGNRQDYVDLQTDDSDLAEGLYFKAEAGGVVRERFKFVRGGFQQAIGASDSHWLGRPILPNRLMDGVDILAPELALSGAYDDPMSV